MSKKEVIIIGLVMLALVIVPASYLYFAFHALDSMYATDPEDVLNQGQAILDPVKVALKEYHQRHGCYPDILNVLVDDGLLAAIPELPLLQGTSYIFGPDYVAIPTLDVCQFSFGYQVEIGVFGRKYFRGFVSDDSKGWHNGRLDSAADFIAERSMAAYKVDGKRQWIECLINDVIWKESWQSLSQERVVAWLGEGTGVTVPPGVPSAGKTGYTYQPDDDASVRFCFVYKDRWVPASQGSLPVHERGKFTDISHPVLDNVFLVRHADGRTTWTLLRDCPKSPNDHRATVAN